ncbi:CinA family nicotinamide mononucleotide deamidase-related protein [Marinobacterium jannaschii]|uniref:CinA family nicotinamide mononucleotide deamidase-related protein n=1 Tax=Marinobacterium jannaschii TaxID=64970 RepID=UPI000484A51E|nr:CinA family nicotinamide mononucleotide deamidase-related protein [Marinobacterium jannaschii]
MKLQLLMTGTELMSGDIVDSNSAMIAEALADVGISIHRKVTVGDELDLLISELTSMSQTADVIIVNGGLGPTRDDMTAEALAQASGLPLETHPEALDHLTRWCEKRGSRLNQANLKQTVLPQHCSIIDNPRGSAVGFHLMLNNCLVICTPGVPSELCQMLSDTIVSLICPRTDAVDAAIRSRFHTYGLGESNLQQWIDDSELSVPEGVELGFRAGAPTLEVKVQGQQSQSQPYHQFVDQLKALIGDYIVSTGSDSQCRALIDQLRQQGRSLATAESCTGGLIASMITAESGSSAVFEAGYVTYSNRIKTSAIGVNPKTLEAHGAVSEAVVIEMAQGALEASGADYAVAVSGIAGPDGGSDDKPVGSVWIAWGDSTQIETACLCLPYGRKMFQTMVAGAALDLIRRRDCGITSTPRYLIDRAGYASKYN